ncbi:hypothetical protein BDN71DRAFT_1507279 [Pleurotus eryngii]|uniref:Uncharacterized protein n=1 Tax=Pleurotus eryngii TaxID=5323 RepID=A0A9P5ZXI2_PLEER|nr:hypothetical protein BDN71DRAFT_1507279 [Pleurotus eryngii]
MSSQSAPGIFPVALLNYEGLQAIQYTITMVLVNAYTKDYIHDLDDDTLCRHVEYYLGWYPNSLDSHHSCTVIAQTCVLVLQFYLDCASTSIPIRYAILGLVLENIRLFWQA